MNKQQLTDAILELDSELNKSGLMAMTKAKLEVFLVNTQARFAEPEATDDEPEGDEPEGDEIEDVSGSRIKQSYRNKYAENATATGRKAHTATGRNTLNNGDQLAIAMESLLPSSVCQIADQVFKLEIGHHESKYGHLNEGMRRMNAGNRIRGAVKRGEIEVEGVIELINAMVDAKADIASEA